LSHFSALFGKTKNLFITQAEKELFAAQYDTAKGYTDIYGGKYTALASNISSLDAVIASHHI